jgi:nucleoside-diphosphate-sugar epimerase
MKVLIAGGAGYVGSRLVPELLSRGYDVTVVDLFWFGNHLPGGVSYAAGDVFDEKVEYLRDYDVVIFMAGLSNDPMAEFSPAMNFISNAAAPAYLAYIAKQAGVKRFIYASSCSVYGYTVNELYDESSPTTCGYPYGISKLQGERGVMHLADKNFSVVALRKGTVCGYSPRMRFDLVVNAMWKSAVKDGIITVNNPAIWRPILGIGDAVRAYIRAIEADPSVSGIFNVASGNYTIGEIADIVKEGTPYPKVNVFHKQDFRNYKVSWERARTVLSFHPKEDVESIVTELSEHRPKFGDFTDSRYYNIETFRRMEGTCASASSAATDKSGVTSQQPSKPEAIPSGF